jgi:uncharacterized protein YggE
MTITIGGSNGAGRPWALIGGVAGLVLGLLITPVLAADPTVPPTGFYPPEHTISVQGVGSIFVKPDLAEVNLGVDVTRSALSDARNDAAKAMNAIMDALHALGIADADIETSYFNVNPVYDYSGVQRVTGYQVTNILLVKVHNLDQLGAVVDNSVAAGATTVNSITFKLSDPTSAQNQARDAAVKDARQRADTLAASAGVSITGVSSINETSYSMPWPIYAGDTYGRAVTPAPEVPTPIIAGNTEITINVSVVYTIG